MRTNIPYESVNKASLGPINVVFSIELPAKLLHALFPLVYVGSHTTNTVGVISQDYKPLQRLTIVLSSTMWYKVCKLHQIVALNLEQALTLWFNNLSIL